MRQRSIILILILACSVSQAQTLKLWYQEPAKATVADNPEAHLDNPEWLKAMPLGNGSLGAMVFGDVGKERIQLNEKTLWSGSHDDNNNPEAVHYIEEIRQLLFKGKFKEATDLTNKTQVCKGLGSGYGSGANVPFGCFQTLGDLWIDFKDTSTYSKYYRDLNLETAVASVSYEQGGVTYSREYFVSAPANVLAVRIKASKKGALSFKATLSRPEKFSVTSEGNELIMAGTLTNGRGGEGMQYITRLQATARDGTKKLIGRQLIVENATEAILYLSASTDYLPLYPVYKGRDHVALTRNAIDGAMKKPYAELRDEHMKDYQKYFNRVSFRISSEKKDTQPTDVRVKNLTSNRNDNFLTQLYFQYGRYLLISSARENTLPANLQGIWANKIQTPWNCDYHTNINVQMNYWLAENTNLSDLHLSLTQFIQSIQAPATQSARVQFGMEGWCINPIVNVWGFTAPGEHPSWGLTSGAGGWIAQHLWEHYAFTLDTAYLKSVYPTLKGAAQFYLDWLTRDPVTGKLVSGPASSPENAFQAPDGSTASISMGPAHDQQIIEELFNNVLRAAEIVNDNDNLLDSIRMSLRDLRGNAVAEDGRLMEWAQAYPEVEPGHRHMSHLYAVYPGYAITKTSSPQFYDAAKKSLQYRLRHGGGHTGWSAAWVTNLWARFKDGNEALDTFNDILEKKSAPNLFDLHPPFQIDGNFGATAGIAEMLLQSHEECVELLPALPAVWGKGKVSGLCARGGVEVAIQWRNGVIEKAFLKSVKSQTIRVKYKDHVISVVLKKGKREAIPVAALLRRH